MKILDHIQLAFQTLKENIDFMQIDLKKTHKIQGMMHFPSAGYASVT